MPSYFFSRKKIYFSNKIFEIFGNKKAIKCNFFRILVFRALSRVFRAKYFFLALM